MSRVVLQMAIGLVLLAGGKLLVRGGGDLGLRWGLSSQCVAALAYTGRALPRWEGVVLIVLHVAGVIWILLESTGHDATGTYTQALFTGLSTLVILLMLTTLRRRQPIPARETRAR